MGLTGCKAASGCTVATESELKMDTTKQSADSTQKTTTKEEKRTTVTLYNDWGRIEFADSGGMLTIDGGLIKADGVKSYRQGKQAVQKQDTDTKVQTDSAATHEERANGIINERRSSTNRQSRAQPQKQGVTALKWYQRTIYHVGALCCLAAIIWTVFLYIKRRK